MRFTQILIAAALALSPIAAGAMARPVYAQPAPTANEVAAQIKPPEAAQPPVTDAKPTFRIVNVDHNDGTAKVPAGSIIGELLMWAALVFGSALAGALMKYVIIPFEKKIGVEVTEKNNNRLQDTIENSIALAAQRAQVSLKDKLEINVRSGVAINALEYVQTHGVETLKGMGVADPTDPKVIEALQARIAKAMDDKIAPPTVAVAAIAAPVVEPGKV